MQKLLWLPFLLVSFSTTLNAQDRTSDYEITLPDTRINNSLYREIELIDSRYDVTNLGVVQLGAFNKKARVVPEVDLSSQLTHVLNALIDSSAEDGQLVLVLRQFNFAEVTGVASEKGYCYLRAQLYTKRSNIYGRLAEIDTVIVASAMDVTKAMFRNGSRTLTNFISNNLTKKPSGAGSFTLADLLHIDDLEKKSLPLYSRSELVDGVYGDYNSFKNQEPGNKAIVEMKNNKISSVKALDENNKEVKVKTKGTYAVVHQGQAYVATDYGFYPLRKINNDFNFIGKAKVQANTNAVVAATVFFGILGGLIAASDSNATFEMKLDHLNGGFIRLKEVATKGF